MFLCSECLFASRLVETTMKFLTLFTLIGFAAAQYGAPSYDAPVAPTYDAHEAPIYNAPEANDTPTPTDNTPTPIFDAPASAYDAPDYAPEDPSSYSAPEVYDAHVPTFDASTPAYDAPGETNAAGSIDIDDILPFILAIIAPDYAPEAPSYSAPEVYDAPDPTYDAPTLTYDAPTYDAPAYDDAPAYSSPQYGDPAGAFSLVQQNGAPVRQNGEVARPEEITAAGGINIDEILPFVLAIVVGIVFFPLISGILAFNFDTAVNIFNIIRASPVGVHILFKFNTARNIVTAVINAITG